MSASDEERLVELREAVDAASSELLHAVHSLCPGEHRVVQHRDMQPPWCMSCGRDDRGVVRHHVPMKR